MMLQWSARSTSMQRFKSFGLITVFAVLPSEKAYMYSIKISFLARLSRIFDKAPGTLGQLIHTTSVSMTAKIAFLSTSTALSTSETMRRSIPKSVVSAMLNACMLMLLAAKAFATSFIRPLLFSRKTEICFIILAVAFLLFQNSVVNHSHAFAFTARYAVGLH